LEQSRNELSSRSRAVELLANLRLCAFLLLLIVCWAALFARSISPWFLILPALIFGVLIWRFDRAEAARTRSERLSSYYQQGLLRLDGEWQGQGNQGLGYKDPEHLYAEDLDLFGPGSLFERIALVRTHAGESTLASWLLNPAAPPVIVARQRSVAELRPRLELREDLAVLGGEVGTEVAFEGLAAWGADAPQLTSRWVRAVAVVLALLAMVFLTAWLGFGSSPLPLILVLLCESLIAGMHLKRVRAVLSQVEKRTHELELLAGMLHRLEKEDFQEPSLKALHTLLFVSGHSASSRIEGLRRWLSTLDARRNMLLGPLSPMLLWGTQVAFGIEAWRASNGPSISGWLSALGQFEALASLASFAYENPDAVFATILEAAPARFEAVGLAHPLLPLKHAVRNDVRLGGGEYPQLLMVSGSNMSGKSTLLRAVGTAVVLSLAGGVARALELRLSPFAVGATLRVHDSLLAGRSRFYAEILRLGNIVKAAAGPHPLLFLLDEILAGTNSHDRRIGAEAVVAGLLARGGLGLVTTHDLALAEITTRIPGRALNVHFGDQFLDGKISFDFRMRPGVVSHSNALELMRSIGLEV
jgi:hypothetical protein